VVFILKLVYESNWDGIVGVCEVQKFEPA